MREFHHIGIPTHEPRQGEEYNERFKIYTSGYYDSAHGVEWMRFAPDSPLPELVKRVPHVAFVVDDLRAEIAGREILIEPNSPADGVTVSSIVRRRPLWVTRNPRMP